MTREHVKLFRTATFDLPDAPPSGNELQVWGMTLSDPPLPVAELREYLSADEIARVERLRQSRDRDRAIIARGGLRAILGTQLGVHPASLAFRYSEKGKPALDMGEDHPPVSFSVSHSGEWVLIAVAAEHRVGADVEALRPIPGFGQIVDRYFAPVECAAIGGVPEERRLDAFFCCWTRKEAYVKALGDGISFGFSRFAVAVDADDTPAILEIEGSADAAAGWTVWSGEPAPGYAAAVAIDTAPIDVVARFWLGSSGVTPWAAGCGHSPLD